MTNWLDYALLAALMLVMPVYGHHSYHQVRERIAAGIPGVRLKAYRQTMLQEWGFVGILLFHWQQAARAPEALGFQAASGWGFWFGLAAALAATAFLVWQGSKIRRDPEAQEKSRIP